MTVDQRPHTIVPELHDDWDVSFRVSCPYPPDDPARPCLLVEEAPICLWKTWVDGEHHPDCGDESCDVWQAEGVGEMQRCWETRGILSEPEHCGGVDNPLMGHSHPASGCGFAENWDAGGYEAVSLDLADRASLDLPSFEVSVAWRDGDYLVAEPSDAVNAEVVR